MSVDLNKIAKATEGALKGSSWGVEKIVKAGVLVEKRLAEADRLDRVAAGLHDRELADAYRTKAAEIRAPFRELG